MSVNEVTMYRVICDRCGESAQEGDYWAWESVESAISEASASDWLVNDDGHWCPDCTIWTDENDCEIPAPGPLSDTGEGE